MTPSKEDYLRTLLELSEKEETIHSIDIAAALGVSRASVSRMMTILKEEDFVAMERYGTISLTPKGAGIASCIRKRHDIIRRYLVEVLEVEEQTARNDACRMEHAISEETTEKLKEQLKKFCD